jgi:hypothetical protein
MSPLGGLAERSVESKCDHEHTNGGRHAGHRKTQTCDHGYSPIKLHAVSIIGIPHGQHKYTFARDN